MTYSVRLTDQTLQAIEDQATYLAVECHAPLNAAGWLERVNEAIDSLSEWPRRCGLAEEDPHRPYEIRKINVGDYLLTYTIDEREQVVWVIGFRHGSRLPRVDDLPESPPSE